MKECEYSNCWLKETGDLNELVEEAYALFQTFLKDDAFVFRGKRIEFNEVPDIISGREGGFEHIATGEQKLGRKKIALYKRKRLVAVPFIKIIIQNCLEKSCNNLKIFPDKKDVLVWCESLAFLIVLSERKDVFKLITAYVVDKSHKKTSVIAKANKNDSY